MLLYGAKRGKQVECTLPGSMPPRLGYRLKKGRGCPIGIVPITKQSDMDEHPRQSGRPCRLTLQRASRPSRDALCLVFHYIILRTIFVPYHRRRQRLGQQLYEGRVLEETERLKPRLDRKNCVCSGGLKARQLAPGVSRASGPTPLRPLRSIRRKRLPAPCGRGRSSCPGGR
jgi:hypothetical protein